MLPLSLSSDRQRHKILCKSLNSQLCELPPLTLDMIVCSKKIQQYTPTTNFSCLNETSYPRPTLSFFSSSARFSWSCVSASLICPGHQANVVSNTIHFWTNTTYDRPLDTLRVCHSWGISQRFLRWVNFSDNYVLFTVTGLISKFKWNVPNTSVLWKF